jgi:exodeoxyribonuclease VII small subunit
MTESRDEQGLDSRLAALESIVDRLDREDLELQEALDLFEEGVGHVREAFAVLENARLRVEKLVVDMEGTASLEPERPAE